MEYTFTLKYRLTDPNPDMDALLERLAEAGCTDALVGIGKAGRLALEFTREAASALEAVASARSDVEDAIPGVELLEMTPDLVGVTDIAVMLEMTRQNLHKIIARHADSFPPPLHEGNPSLWRLSGVLDWMDSQVSYRIDPEMLEVSRVASEVNMALWTAQLPPHGAGRRAVH